MPPSGGRCRPTLHACGRPQAGHRVATSASSSPGSKWGSAKESQAQPPHHSVRVPITEKPSGMAEKGWAMTI